MTEKMVSKIGIARTVAESAIVVCASGLAALTFSDGFYAFAAVCAFIAIAMQALVCLRTRLHEKLEGKTCENCGWLRYERKGYYYCMRLEGSSKLSSVVLYPPEEACEFWKENSRLGNGGGTRVDRS